MLCWSFFFFIIISSANGQQQNSNPLLHPVILIPGYLRSRLDVTFDRDSVAWPAACPLSQTTPRVLWLDATYLAPIVQDCWFQNIRLHYDRNTSRTFNDPGVNVFPHPPFGTLDGVDYTSPPPQQNDLSLYYGNFVQALEQMGYRRDVNLKGVNYDFRKAINEDEELVTGLKNLVEETYTQNGNVSVILSSHSQGGQNTYAFLRMQSASWKQKFIKSWVTVAAPFGGTFGALYGSLASDDLPPVLPKILRTAERTWPSRTWSFPRILSFGNDVLIQSTSRSYTSRDIRDVLLALNESTQLEYYQNTVEIYSDEDFESPGTTFPILCLTGSGRRTRESVVVHGELRKGAQMEVMFGDGDELVNAKGTRICQRFGSNNRNFHYREINAEHVELITGEEGISVVVNFIDDINRGVIKE